MYHVPKKPALPLSRGNTRSVLLGSHTGKADARVIQWQALPHLELAAHPGQLGGLPGRTVALGTLLVRMHLRQAVKRRRPAAVLFVAFLLGWFASWIVHRVTRVTQADMGELDKMAQSLHEAEETRDEAITYMQQREAELTNQLTQTEAELQAAILLAWRHRAMVLPVISTGST